MSVPPLVPSLNFFPARKGDIRWSPVRSLWLLAMYLGAAIWAVPTWSWGSLGVFFATSGILLCLGFSVGLHRGVIHRSFEMSPWLEHGLMWLAALNGFGGVLSLIRMHERRDYWQNRSRCPEYYAYRHGPWRDYLWYLHMSYRGEPEFEPVLRREVGGDPLYRILERSWILQPLLLGALLYLAGGWPWFVWGLLVRVSVTLTGVWLVNYAVHRHGYRNFEIPQVILEGGNSVLFGLISMGEGWHNNHHALPRSARLGLAWWELDPGYWCIRILEGLRLVRYVRRPGDGVLRPEARPLRSGIPQPDSGAVAGGPTCGGRRGSPSSRRGGRADRASF
jgi:fatty-acid desaturase